VHAVTIDNVQRATYQANRETVNERHRHLYKKKREAEGKTYRPGYLKTHCVNGHELTPENIYYGKNGRRIGCKACRRANTRAHYYANHDEEISTRVPTPSAGSPREDSRLRGRVHDVG
jgi:hypothetical protein